MKKLLIQIDVKDELPTNYDDIIVWLDFKNDANYYLAFFNIDEEKFEIYDADDLNGEVKFWYKEVDQRTYDIELLEKYSKFLEKEGFTDIDWRAEELFAIDEFLKDN